MGSLPIPPSVQYYTGTAPNAFQGYNQPAFGTQMYPASQGANIVQGISAFLEQFQKQRSLDKQQNAEKAEQAIKNMMLGLPVDLKKTASYMKKAGMELDFETPVKQPPVSPPMGQGGGAVQPAATGGAPPQTGFWGRVGQAMGVGSPAYNPQSVGAAALQQLAARGRLQQQLAQRELEVKGKELDLREKQIPAEAQKAELEQVRDRLTIAALQGNEGARQTLKIIGVIPKGKYEDVVALGVKMGMKEEDIGRRIVDMELGTDQVRQQNLVLAEKMKDRFGGDMTKSMKYITDIRERGVSDLTPSEMGLDERMKAAEIQRDVMKRYPTLPLNVANQYAMSVITDDKEYKSQLEAAIEKNFPKEEEIASRKWTADYNLSVSRLNQDMSQFNRNFSLAMANAIRSELGDQWGRATQILTSKESSDEERNTARKMIENASLKLGTLEVDGIKLNLGTGLKAEKVDSFLNSINPFASDQYELKLEDAPAWMSEDQKKAYAKAQEEKLKTIRQLTSLSGREPNR